MADPTPRQMLARVMAGMPANSSAPDKGGMSPWLPPFEAPGQMGRFMPPRMPQSVSSLPPYEQPGGVMQRYLPPFTNEARPPAPPMPAMAPAVPPAMPPPEGGQGWGGPEPAPGTIAMPQEDPRYLPEHWRGAFNTRWQT